MSGKRKENWIKIMTPEGETRIASPGYVKNLMGLDLRNIQNRLSHIERKIDKLESPMRQEKIIETLRGQGPHNRDWLFNRCDLRLGDLRGLIEKGIIIESRSGTHRMLELADTEEELT